MQPVNELDFWKQRIKEAKEEHKSVYNTTSDSWKRITEIHKKIVQDLCGNSKILDAGCGYGRVSEWLKNYVGIDFSPDFIDMARGKYPDKKFLVANLKNLPFVDKEFDWAIVVSIRNMIIGYESKEAWQQMEKELKRVAKKVLILEYTSPDKYEIL